MIVRKTLSLIASLPLALLAFTLAATAADYVVKPVSVAVMKSVFGQVESHDVLAARARIGGTVDAIAVKVGDEVAKGDVVATVVDPKLALKLDALDARIKAIAAQFDNARTNLERARQLFAQGTIAKSRLDDLQTQADVLTNDLGALEADRSVVVQQSAEGTIEAPANGRVLAVPLSPGSVIMPGETVATIAGGGYFLRLSLPERHAQGIAKGGTVMVAKRGVVPSASGETSLKGTIVTVYPEIADGRVLADVEVEGLGDFFVGERTLVSIPIGSREAIAVPPAAVLTRHGLDFVALRRGDQTIEVSVVPGESLATPAGPMTEILTGLKAGDTVVVP